MPDQQLELPDKISSAVEREQAPAGIRRNERFAILVTSESKCRRITIRP
jgi:hypothetical protein